MDATGESWPDAGVEETVDWMILATNGKMLLVGVRLVPYWLRADSGIWRVRSFRAAGRQADGEPGEASKGTDLWGPPPPPAGAEAAKRDDF
jgi:hypothetical protein